MNRNLCFILPKKKKKEEGKNSNRILRVKMNRAISMSINMGFLFDNLLEIEPNHFCSAAVVLL